jgi:lipopolysaccharide transport system permease protein
MEITIKPGTGAGRYWRDLWSYRELLWFLTWRDLLVRYKQTAAGIGWAVLRPVLSMLALAIVFGRFAKLPSDGAPYAVFVLAALLPWQFFSNALSESGMSLLNNAGLVSKVYFPRMIVPASAMAGALIDFAISILLMAGLMAWHQYIPSWRVLYLPLFVLLAILCATGAGLWASALIIRFRDVRMIIPFVAQFGFFVSPIGYSSALVPPEWRVAYSLNPMAGIVDAFRWATLQQPGALYIGGLLVSIALSLLLLISGLFYFRSVERNLADSI